jgi:hypothetical protein
MQIPTTKPNPNPNQSHPQLKVPMPFLTTIVVPIVGNAAEHASALIFAVKNRMEVALGVAVGAFNVSGGEGGGGGWFGYVRDMWAGRVLFAR